MTDIPSFAYADLWGERPIRSVANLTRADGHEFLELAPAGRRACTGSSASRSRAPRLRSSGCARVGCAAPPYSRSNEGSAVPDVTVKRADEFETYFLGAMSKVRSGLGVESFGMQLMDCRRTRTATRSTTTPMTARRRSTSCWRAPPPSPPADEEHRLEPGVCARVGPG